jgi:hypothetical protein
MRFAAHKELALRAIWNDPSSSHTPKLFECYMVKPHGQLVLVSFIDYSTSTPSLSTS